MSRRWPMTHMDQWNKQKFKKPFAFINHQYERRIAVFPQYYSPIKSRRFAANIRAPISSPGFPQHERIAAIYSLLHDSDKNVDNDDDVHPTNVCYRLCNPPAKWANIRRWSHIANKKTWIFFQPCVLLWACSVVERRAARRIGYVFTSPKLMTLLTSNLENCKWKEYMISD